MAIVAEVGGGIGSEERKVLERDECVLTYVAGKSWQRMFHKLSERELTNRSRGASRACFYHATFGPRFAQACRNFDILSPPLKVNLQTKTISFIYLVYTLSFSFSLSVRKNLIDHIILKKI